MKKIYNILHSNMPGLVVNKLNLNVALRINYHVNKAMKYKEVLCIYVNILKLFSCGNVNETHNWNALSTFLVIDRALFMRKMILIIKFFYNEWIRNVINAIW